MVLHIVLLLGLVGGMADTRPPLSDAKRLPDIETLELWNTQFLAEYNRVGALPRGKNVKEWLIKNELIALWYQHAMNTHPSYGSIEEERRDSLAKLREIIGAKRYYSGDWPSPANWPRLLPLD